MWPTPLEQVVRVAVLFWLNLHPSHHQTPPVCPGIAVPLTRAPSTRSPGGALVGREERADRPGGL